MDVRKDCWLSKALENAFLDPSKKKLCQDESRRAIANQNINRIFDYFECLAPDEIIKEYAEEYFKISKSITKTRNQEGEPLALELNQINATNNLLRKIIKTGIFELLDKPNHIREDLVNILNWHDITDQIDQVDLLCAFTGAIFQIIYDKYRANIEENNQTCACIEMHINKEYKKLIIAVLLEYNYITKYEAEKKLHIVMSKNENIFKSPVVTASIVTLSLAALAGLAFGIFSLVRANTTNQDKDEHKDSSPSQVGKEAK